MRKVLFLLINIITIQTFFHAQVNGASSVIQGIFQQHAPHATDEKIQTLAQVKEELIRVSSQPNFDHVPKDFSTYTKAMIAEFKEKAQTMYPAYFELAGESYSLKELFGETIGEFLAWLGNSEESPMPTQEEIDSYRSYRAIQELILEEIALIERIIRYYEQKSS